MAVTTLNWLQNNPYARLAITVVFEGWDMAYTTTDDTTGMATAWSGTDWTTFRTGLSLVGATGGSIKPFDPEIQVDDLTIQLLDDSSDSLAGILFRQANLQASVGDLTYLTSTLEANDTSGVTVKDNSSFSTSGSIYVGVERITYTSKPSSTTFGGTIVRGNNSIFGIDGGTRFGRIHHVSNIYADGPRLGPAVTDYPRVWLNRPIGIYVHHWEGSAWSTKANSLFAWAGVIKSFDERAGGMIEFQCSSILDLLFGDVFSKQYEAEVLPALRLDKTGMEEFSVRCRQDALTASPDNYESAVMTFGTFGDLLTVEEIIAGMNEAIKDESHGTSIPNGHRWKVTRRGDGRVQVGLRSEESVWTHDDSMGITMHPDVWAFLGGGSQISMQLESATTVTGDDGRVLFDGFKVKPDQNKMLVQNALFITTSLPHKVATVTANFWGQKGSIPAVSGEVNDYFTQTDFVALPITHPTGAESVLEVEGHMFAVSKQTTSSIVHYDVHQTLTKGGFSTQVLEPEEGQQRASISVGDESRAMKIKQVWLEESEEVGKTLLRYMLSTGSNAYNHATYDKGPDMFGLSLPANLIDIESFESLRGKYRFLITGPTSFGEMIQPILSVYGRHIVWRNGKITATGLSIQDKLRFFTLSESNKAIPDEHMVGRYAMSGLVNRATLKYNRGDRGKLLRTVTLNYVDSQSDQGQVMQMSIEAPGLDEDGANIWVDSATDFLDIFSQPTISYSRSYDSSLIDLTPGDAVLVSDDHVIDPQDGARGVSGLACFCARSFFDWSTGIGQVELLYDSVTGTLGAPYAPSARVTAYSADTPTSGKSTITCTANAYSHSSDNSDVTYFSAGDKCRIVEISESSAPDSYAATVDSVDGGANQIVFTSNLVGFNSSLTHICKFNQATATLTEDQFNRGSFIASNANSVNSGGVSAPDFYVYLPDNSYNRISETSAVVTDFIREFPSTEYVADDAFDAHNLITLVNNLNNLYQHKTKQRILTLGDNDPWSNITGGTTLVLSWGPVWIPYYGGGRSWRARVRARLNGSATTGDVILYTAASFIESVDSSWVISPVEDSSSVTFNFTSTSYAWSSWTTFKPLVIKTPHGETGTWLMIAAGNCDANTIQTGGLIIEEV